MTARTDDYDQIVRVVQLYIDAFNDNDISKFKEAFDEDAWMYYINPDGSLYKDLISKSFREWASPPSSGIVGRFISVTQVGDAASVQLSFDYASGGSVSVHARSQFRGRFCSGMMAPGRGSKADGMRRVRWGSDFGAA